MPNSRSAKKRMRQAQSRTERNRRQRSALRTALKRVRQAEDRNAAQEALRTAEQALDRAARKRLIHPNAAARAKSRLQTVTKSKS